MNEQATAPVAVRSACHGDYPRLAAVFDEAERLHREALPAVFRKPTGLFPSRQLFAQYLGGQDCAVFVAGDSPDLDGFVTVRAGHTAPDQITVARRFAVVEMLAVRSDRRRRGIGARLMDAAQSWAAARGLERVVLEVWEFNRAAIAFYQSLGYATMSRRMEIPLGGTPKATTGPLTD